MARIVLSESTQRPESLHAGLSFAESQLAGGMTMTRITTLRLPICNVYLLRGTKAILVDTGRPSDAERLRAMLAQEGQSVEDIALILHTHGHWDHAGSTCQLKQWTRAPAAVHRADADKMRRGDSGVLKPVGLSGWLLRLVVGHGYPGLEPDILLENEFDLRPFGVAARVVGTPGHTAGSISILTAEGDAIVGDLMMGGFFGGKIFRSRPRYHYFADDLEQVRASIRKVLALAPKRILPGHGGPLDPGRVARRFGLQK